MGRKIKEIHQYDIFWVGLDPTVGSEIKKTRPGVILSPDELNEHLNTVVAAPLSKTIKTVPFRINCMIKKTKCSILVDQVRAVDKSRLSNKIGRLSEIEIARLKKVLHDIFVV